MSFVGLVFFQTSRVVPYSIYSSPCPFCSYPWWGHTWKLSLRSACASSNLTWRITDHLHVSHITVCLFTWLFLSSYIFLEGVAGRMTHPSRCHNSLCNFALLCPSHKYPAGGSSLGCVHVGCTCPRALYQADKTTVVFQPLSTCWCCLSPIPSPCIS